MGFFLELVGDLLGRAVFVTEGEAFLGDVGVFSRGDGSRVRISQFADDENASWCGRFSRCGLKKDVRGHQPVLFENVSRPTAGDAELIEDVSLDTFACNFDDHPDTRRDESDITAVELAAVRHVLAVDSLRSFVEFAHGLIQIWYIYGTYDQL